VRCKFVIPLWNQTIFPNVARGSSENMTLMFAGESDLIIIHFHYVYRVSFEGKETCWREITNYDILQLSKVISQKFVHDISLEARAYDEVIWFYYVTEARQNTHAYFLDLKNSVLVLKEFNWKEQNV
jgi:hypothetical protein